MKITVVDRILLAICCVLSTLFLMPVSAQQVNTVDDLQGRWQGKWDGLFKMEFIIQPHKDSKDFQVTYQWEENIGQPMTMQKTTYQQINNNTIGNDGKYLVMHPSEKDQALAIGIFKSLTRIAYLKKVPLK